MTRQASAARIIADPWSYQVCMGCDSILKRQTGEVEVVVCRNCGAYHMDQSPFAVISQARHSGAREQETITREDMS